MKRSFFMVLLCYLALSGTSQFLPQPLNYPGTGYWPFYYSISDPEHMWVGTLQESGIPYSLSVKTTDGGNSWIFDSIPVPGSPGCVSICGWDANICFFVFVDMGGVNSPSIWKTTDGGTTWSNIITTQFANSFINFYHAFSADTGLAMGDPRDGYFEIQLTYNGGATWTRISSSDIPAPLTNELGVNDHYSAVGNSIWFGTNKSRCYHSADRGQTWDVTEVFTGINADLGVCFSTELKGAAWNGGAAAQQIVVTTDGGVTWEPVSFPADYTTWEMSSVPGWEGAFVVTAFKMGSGMNVYFTPDMFNTLLLLEGGILSNGAVKFYDAATGWLGGGESGTDEIYKFTWVLNSDDASAGQKSGLLILPNPSSGQALLKLPEGLDPKNTEIRVTNLAGKILARYPLHDKKYGLLDASQLADGVYLVVLCHESKALATTRWLVNH